MLSSHRRDAAESIAQDALDKVIRILVSIFRMFVIESFIELPARGENELALETLRIIIYGLSVK